MFKFDPRPVFSAKVTVRTPSLDGHVDEDFRATFKALPIDEFNAIDLSTEAGARAFLVETLHGAEDIADTDGKSLPYDDVLRDAMINAVHVRTALISAYVRELGKAAQGN